MKMGRFSLSQITKNHTALIKEDSNFSKKLPRWVKAGIWCARIGTSALFTNHESYGRIIITKFRLCRR